MLLEATEHYPAKIVQDLPFLGSCLSIAKLIMANDADCVAKTEVTVFSFVATCSSPASAHKHGQCQRMCLKSPMSV